MGTHKPIPEVAGVAESLGVTTARTLANPLYHLVFDIADHLLRVRVKAPHANPHRHAIEVNFAMEDERSPAELFAVYHDDVVYAIPAGETPGAGSTMNLTLKSRHEIDHPGNRKQANFASDYTLDKYLVGLHAETDGEKSGVS